MPIRRVIGGIFVFLIFTSMAEFVTGCASAQMLPVDGHAILDHLNAAIGWYRHVSAANSAAGEPSDVLYLQNARSSANQALQLAFQAAQAQAALLSTAQAGNTSQIQNTDQAGAQSQDQQNLGRAAANASDQLDQVQSQIQSLEKQIASARGKRRANLISQRAALQGELDLDRALADALGKITSFMASSDNAKTGIDSQIAQLKASVPDLSAQGGTATNTEKPSMSQASRADASGLFGQASVLFGQMRDVHDIDQLMNETTHLREKASNLQLPLRGTLRQLIQQGRAAAAQPPDGTTPGAAQARRHQLELLTAQFRTISNASIPLRQEIILLDQCHANLAEWRDSIVRQYKHVLGVLLIRVAGILIALGIVFAISDVWRRATIRYISDARRRRQLLIIRRFVMGFLMVLVVVLGFISEFSSLATFAGFITAGIAVALQTIILSIAAYFFLIGRYGVRVGDRITVSGVTGDVIDIGLVRLYLMELAGTGIDLYPTGRVVVFSNSVLFQATPLYKQIPGTSYAWHELAVTLNPASDHQRLVEETLMRTVNGIYEQYRHSLERQHSVIEQLLDITVSMPAPHSKLQFADSGLELVVRYPVVIQHSEEVDDHLTRTLLDTIANTPDLHDAVSGIPKLRSAIKA